MFITESLCHIPEINTALYIKFNSFKKTKAEDSTASGYLECFQ